MKALLLAPTLGTLMAVAACAAQPAPATNSYQQIYRRNVFNLQPIPTAPVQPDPPVVRPPPPKVFITGLVEIRGVSKALVEIREPGKAVDRHILAAGNGLERLQVLQVDVPAGNVRIRLDNTEETLTLEKPKVPPAGPPPLPIVPRTPISG